MTRLTGLGITGADGTLTQETVSLDVSQNETVTKVYTDRDNIIGKRVADYPDSASDEISRSENGLPKYSQSRTGTEATYNYDPLGRKEEIIRHRNNNETTLTTVGYNSLGQIQSVIHQIEDSDGNPGTRTTEYTYCPETGLKETETAEGKTTRYKYDEYGRITGIWGNAAYPVRYGYDNYGRLVNMCTYRHDNGWNAEDWPVPDAAACSDETVWNYDDPHSGLLTGKTDAGGNSVIYTYTAGGKLKTRTWARQNNGGELITSYDYYDKTGGELKSITYSDNSATSPVTFAYDRLGRQETVTDAAGTRTFTYDPDSLRLKSETVEGGSLYGTDDTVITRSYDTADGVKGRPTGFSLNMSGLPSPDYSVTYGYDGTGRFSSVAWNAGSASGGSAYTYVPKSDQIYRMTTDYGQTTTYSYKPHRNLRTQVKNEFSGTVISRYDYKYDSLGRRSHVANTGSAFSAPVAYNDYGYNDRSELTESRRYSGTPATENPSRYRSYLYDNIGNRNQAVRRSDTPETADYVPNKLNQYDSLTVSGAGTTTFTHDEDGNLTSDSTLNYTYNAENRLIVAEPKNPAVAGGVKVEFTYDYMGRRIRKAVYTMNTDNTDWNTTPQSEKLFVYDGWNMIAELTKNGGATTPAKYYVWGLDLSQPVQGAGGIGGLLARLDKQSAIVYYYLYDTNGNVGQLVNAADGSIDAHYEIMNMILMETKLSQTARDLSIMFSNSAQSFLTLKQSFIITGSGFFRRNWDDG